MILESFRLDGRAALVTGAARGIGRAIASGLEEAGARIARLDIAVPSDAGDQTFIESDLQSLDSNSADEVIAQVVEQLGRLDILVNNAGIIRRADALEYSEEDWSAVLQVDLSAAFLLSQAAARQLVKQGGGGKIINVCSMLSFQGGFRVAAYAAAKSGLAGLTRALANEWAPLGINVNAIAPGYFATEVTAAIRADAERNNAILSRLPAGRWGEPEDVQGAAVFLASGASHYVHGVVLPVDGGWLAW